MGDETAGGEGNVLAEMIYVFYAFLPFLMKILFMSTVTACMY